MDIIFLADNIGPIGSLVAAARREADDIIARTSTLAGDVAWTVASYKDFPQLGWSGFSDYPFRYEQTITIDPTPAADSIRSWAASGGADRKGSGLYALSQIAINPSSYLKQSDRYVLRFGDEPSHDPVDTRDYPGPTLDETVEDFLAADITVLGVDLRNLNGDGELFRIVGTAGGLIGALTGNLSDLIYNSLIEVIDPRSDLTINFSILGTDGASRFSFMNNFEGLTRGSYTLVWDTAELTSELTFNYTAFNADPGSASTPLRARLPLLSISLVGLFLAGSRRRVAV